MLWIVLLFLALSTLSWGLPSQTDSIHPSISFDNITEVEWTWEFEDENVKRAYSKPQMGVNFPDPSLIYGDGSWKAYATSSNGKKVPVATSPDAWTWTLTTHDALPDVGTWVSTTNQGIWAPDVQKNDDGVYVMYDAARDQSGVHCIGAATSKTAIGPFTPQAKPLLCNDAGLGVIDPAGYDDGKNRWIYWKVDGNGRGGASTCHSGPSEGSYYYPTPIMIQRIARDALTLLDSPKTILDNDGKANDGVVEAPSIYKAPNGEFVLFYSAHCYASDDYDIEWAWSKTIDGSYGSRGVLARTADKIGIYGPGGLDIDPNGKNAVFHGRLAAGQGGSGSRRLFSATLKFDGKYVTGI